MVDNIEEFCRLLRKNGVRVSTAEIADACRATKLLDVGDVASFREGLAATLIKRREDQASFDELFRLYFRRAVDVGGHGSLARVAAGDDALVDFISERLAEQAAGLSQLARLMLGLGGNASSLISAAAEEVQLERIQSPLQVGFYSYRMMQVLGVDRAESEATAVAQDVLSSGGAAGEIQSAGSSLIRSNVRELKAAVRRFVDEEFRRQNTDYARRLATAMLRDKPLGSLSQREYEALRDEVRRLARMLRARVSRERRWSKSGRLDVGKTLRHALASDGVPFRVAVKRRHRKKPRVVVLCDISDSVKSVSQLMLYFVYALHDCFDRIESFAFVSEIGELSELFRRYDADRAVALAREGAVVNIYSNSNYGSAFSQFGATHLGRITSRTTVLIIGDARNNYNAPRADVLEDIARRAQRVIWLNPESAAAWGFGDSEMPEYRKHCDQVVVAHSLETLESVMEDLVAAHR